jgi:Glycosyl hydrolase family 65, N-terminal domain
VHPHVGAVRLRMTPHWSGDATVTDVIDGAGARRLAQTGGGPRGNASVDVTFGTETTATAGAVASTLKPGAGVAASSERRGPASDLTASHALTFPVRAGQSYELVKYVRVDLTRAASGARTGIRELAVIRAH